jgi:hypothetical protein
MVGHSKHHPLINIQSRSMRNLTQLRLLQQEAHGHAVDPQSEEPYPTPFGPGDQETPCLDQLRKDALEYPAKADTAPAQDLSGAEESEVDESELEDLILAAHLGTEDPKEELEVADNGAGSLAGTAEGQEGGAEQQPAEEEYTDAQYYEWLNWQASQQGAAAAAKNGPPATVVVHHHHYYYPVDASGGNSNQPQPSQPSVQNEIAVPTPAVPAVSQYSCAPAGPLANPLSEPRIQPILNSDPASWPLYISSARAPYHTVPAFSSSSWQASRPLFSNPPGVSGQLEAPIGTRGTKFEPTVETEGGDWSRLMTITAMKEYQGKSLEELHVDDYPLGTRGIQFQPTLVEDPGGPPDQYQSPTAMKVYCKKSLEELRWEDRIIDAARATDDVATDKGPTREASPQGEGVPLLTPAGGLPLWPNEGSSLQDKGPAVGRAPIGEGGLQRDGDIGTAQQSQERGGGNSLPWGLPPFKVAARGPSSPSEGRGLDSQEKWPASREVQQGSGEGTGAQPDLRRGEERQEGEATKEPSAVIQAGEGAPILERCFLVQFDMKGDAPASNGHLLCLHSGQQDQSVTKT